MTFYSDQTHTLKPKSKVQSSRTVTVQKTISTNANGGVCTDCSSSGHPEAMSSRAMSRRWRLLRTCGRVQTRRETCARPAGPGLHRRGTTKFGDRPPEEGITGRIRRVQAGSGRFRGSVPDPARVPQRPEPARTCPNLPGRYPQKNGNCYARLQHLDFLLARSYLCSDLAV